MNEEKNIIQVGKSTNIGKNVNSFGTVQRDVNIYIQGTQNANNGNYENYESFENREDVAALLDLYIQKSVEYCSMKKTLLYAEQPHSFYELYVCNNLSYYRSQIAGVQNDKSEHLKDFINDATPERLEEKSKYVIIAGTFGIGKSMFLTHMFLSAANTYAQTKKFPVLATLKDYSEETRDIVDFILKFVKAFAPQISRRNIIHELENKRILLMLDGLDEIQSTLVEKFNADLEDFVKAYSGNSMIMTSRRTSSFISYTRFSVFNIEPLTKEQALQLINKLSYWDEQAKADFCKALDNHLYETHKQFASNPLLLTIMLMTYTTFGEVPSKIHVFYAKAYETMARLHDATKGSYKRPFKTGLTPEEFAKLFAEFCARTYKKEKTEFTSREFASYMDKVLNGKAAQFAREKGVTSNDCLWDITYNLCIMYRDGDKYYFIHRSFQEYFAALFFAFDYDSNLKKVGTFFEKTVIGSSTNKTFDMLYDMIPEKVERYIFLPYLDELMNYCEASTESETYWNFLEKLYPVLFYKYGIKQFEKEENKNDYAYDDKEEHCGNNYHNEARSFLYRTIIREKKLKSEKSIDDLSWPIQVYENLDTDWINEFRKLYETSGNSVSAKRLINTVVSLSINLRYSSADNRTEIQPNRAGAGQENVGHYSFAVIINEIRTNSSKFFEVRQFMENSNFPLMEEYRNVRNYYNELKSYTEEDQESDDFLDD